MNHHTFLPRSLACSLLAAGLALTGCSGFPGGSDGSSSEDSGNGKPKAIEPTGGSGLVAQSEPPVADLPVPLGFKLDEARSRDFEAGDVRFVDHVYRGQSAGKEAVARFYRRQMVNKGWNLRSSRMVRGVIEQKYDKGDENCDVSIRNHNPTLGRSFVEVTLNLYTTGQASDPSS